MYGILLVLNKGGLDHRVPSTFLFLNFILFLKKKRVYTLYFGPSKAKILPPTLFLAVSYTLLTFENADHKCL